MYGPYKRLEPGRYQLIIVFEETQRETQMNLLVEVYTKANAKDAVLAYVDVIDDQKPIVLQFNWLKEHWDGEVEFRVHQRGAAGAKLRELELQRVK